MIYPPQKPSEASEVKAFTSRIVLINQCPMQIHNVFNLSFFAYQSQRHDNQALVSVEQAKIIFIALCELKIFLYYRL